jgi:GT2 family glycosyltransferase
VRAPVLVTVVTPVLNRLFSIRSCLESVSEQDYPAVEHIVVDGGSTDGTLDTVQSFRSRHRLRWISEPDNGMYEAINKGLALAEGEVIAYLNSDDLYLPWSIEVGVDELAKGNDLVYGDLGLLKIISEEDSRFFLHFYPRFDFRYYTYSGAIGQPTVFWRRSLTDRIGGFDTGYKLLGDCEYWLRAAAADAKLSHVSEVLAIQIDHGETLRSTQQELLQVESERMQATYASVAGKPPSPRTEKLRESLRWRWYQFLFSLSFRRPAPKRWARFIRFARAIGIQLGPVRAFVLNLLPIRRPRKSMWIDTRPLRKALLEGLDADVPTGQRAPRRRR